MTNPLGPGGGVVPVAPSPDTTLAGRLLENVVIDPATGCWVWQLRTCPSGYGQIKYRGKSKRTHRVAYEAFRGPIPDGLSLDHLCHDTACVGGVTCPHRRCINPDHLEPVTTLVNVRRAHAATPDKAITPPTQCANGHEFTPENTYVRKDGGYRRCRECARVALHRHYQRRKSAA